MVGISTCGTAMGRTWPHRVSAHRSVVLFGVAVSPTSPLARTPDESGSQALSPPLRLSEVCDLPVLAASASARPTHQLRLLHTCVVRLSVLWGVRSARKCPYRPPGVSPVRRRVLHWSAAVRPSERPRPMVPSTAQVSRHPAPERRTPESTCCVCAAVRTPTRSRHPRTRRSTRAASGRDCEGLIRRNRDCAASRIWAQQCRGAAEFLGALFSPICESANQAAFRSQRHAAECG
jgi:hypothetical protein